MFIKKPVAPPTAIENVAPSQRPITRAQFHVLVSLSRVPDTVAAACWAVLYLNQSQKSTAEEFGIFASNLSRSLKRITSLHERISDVYGTTSSDQSERPTVPVRPGFQHGRTKHMAQVRVAPVSREQELAEQERKKQKLMAKGILK